MVAMKKLFLIILLHFFYFVHQIVARKLFFQNKTLFFTLMSADFFWESEFLNMSTLKKQGKKGKNNIIPLYHVSTEILSDGIA